MASTIEDQLKAATTSLDLPGVLLVASDATNDFHYEKIFGVRSLKEGAAPEPMQKDDIFWIASCTKLMTSIAALQCIERGLFTLDEDVTKLLPELKDIEILTGFEKGTQTPILAVATKTITVRLLLTHASGLAYDAFTPILRRWRKSRGEETHLSKGSLLHRCTTPLLFEPGEGFAYSTGHDWVGIMIERATGITLGEFMRNNIWDPLGITSMTFHPEQQPEIRSSMVDMSQRLGGENLFGTPANPMAKVVWSKDNVWAPNKDDSGGGGAFVSHGHCAFDRGRATDYIKILRSITSASTSLLTPQSTTLLFTPQLSGTSLSSLTTLLRIRELNDSMALSMPMGTKLNYSLGGMITLEDIPGRRRKGSMFWSGLPNVFWWADREGGMCGVYTSQMMPTGDPRSLAMLAGFEKEMYRRAKEAGKAKGKERL
ncbi:beta-lactamase/transpeptidase-like protein [Amylocarpus encephaloides]|uniref:Beta-lactamase/transpeptidase-like protein n=1 Tax=Amylocarpus encephaloides TaxID=45428 RepID=A0A9P7YJZ1_9HELO|nr:beta-lactamase/transpeptidase-like protein [Amylocarpus encephaloides]